MFLQKYEINIAADDRVQYNIKVLNRNESSKTLILLVNRCYKIIIANDENLNLNFKNKRIFT